MESLPPKSYWVPSQIKQSHDQDFSKASLRLQGYHILKAVHSNSWNRRHPFILHQKYRGAAAADIHKQRVRSCGDGDKVQEKRFDGIRVESNLRCIDLRLAPVSWLLRPLPENQCQKTLVHQKGWRSKRNLELCEEKPWEKLWNQP